MKICLCRVDDRLVHGQITAAWTKNRNISTIFVVDDALASDRLAARVISMTVPSRLEVQVLSVSQMSALLQNSGAALEEVRAMILFRSLQMANDLFAQNGRIVDTLILGGMPSKLGREEVGKNLFLSKEEVELVARITDSHGIAVVLQMLPNDMPVDVSSMLSDY